MSYLIVLSIPLYYLSHRVIDRGSSSPENDRWHLPILLLTPAGAAGIPTPYSIGEEAGWKWIEPRANVGRASLYRHGRDTDESPVRRRAVLQVAEIPRR